jgi:hypothetical protein
MTSIPRWDAKFYTHTFFNVGQGKNNKVYKIPRNLNTTEARERGHVTRNSQPWEIG